MRPWCRASHEVSRVRSPGREFAHRVADSGVKHERRVRETGQSLQASTSRVTGWTFSVAPCPDRSPSRHPTGTLAPQCACLALVLVVGETARHLSRQQPDRFSCPLRWQTAFRTRSGRLPTADHLLSGSRSCCTCRSFFRCAIRRHIPQADSGF